MLEWQHTYRQIITGMWLAYNTYHLATKQIWLKLWYTKSTKVTSKVVVKTVCWQHVKGVSKMTGPMNYTRSCCKTQQSLQPQRGGGVVSSRSSNGISTNFIIRIHVSWCQQPNAMCSPVVSRLYWNDDDKNIDECFSCLKCKNQPGPQTARDPVGSLAWVMPRNETG